MSETRAHLRALAEALPAGSAVPVPREWLLELLDGTLAAGADVGNPPTLTADLTCREAGTLLGRSASTVRTWLESGELEGYKQRAREWRITPGAIERFRELERARGATPASAPPKGGPRGRPVDLGAWRKAASRSQGAPPPRRDPAG
jgi:excisionase family DNA binding protein